MVKRKHFFTSLLMVFLLSFVFVQLSNAQNRIYTFNSQYSKLWINQDGTVDLLYNVSLTLVSGSNINYVTLGQPNKDFTIGNAYDQNGNDLQTSVSSDGTGVKITLQSPLTPGNSVWFTLSTNVANLIGPDDMNSGNLGMQFAPEWQAVPIEDVRIQIVLPPNVTVNEVKTPTNAFWNNTSIEADGRLAIYWERSVLAANEKFIVGVSFPSKYLPAYQNQPSGSNNFSDALIVLVPLSFIAVVIALFAVARKRTYSSPKISMETLGVRRGLTAVEASYLLRLKPTQIVAEMLYSLLKKQAIWVESASPVLKIKLTPKYEDKKGPEDSPLRYYEIDFLVALKKDGSLDEEKLAKTVMYLRDTLEQKLKGYSRKDTIEYYRKIVDKAWNQVEQAGTDEIASKAYDEQLLWLLLDPNYSNRTQTTFKNRIFEPSPLWFWYWYGYTQYKVNPTYKPNIDAPTQSLNPPKIPGAEFANNIATSVEKTSANIVANIEKFANAILPMQPAQASHQPAHQKSDCVCACAACACACACVSCACACAGGGVG
jgi:hypothetical protein